MSGFPDNPFGEPVDNPFADPAIQQVAQSTTNQQRSLEDYNPFEEENKPKTNAVPAAIVQPSSQQMTISNNQPTVQSPVSGSLGLDDFHRRQAELDRRAAELDRREQMMNSGGAARLNNWPPLPEKCCFQPCFYHDIDQEIPSPFQKIVRNLYYVWIMYAGVMCVNIIGGMVLMISEGEFTTFGLGILYAFLFTPASFLCWYRPAYKAFKTDSSLDFMVFFFIFFCQMVVTIVQTIGIPGTGTCGFIMSLQHFKTSKLLGLFLLLIACGYGICAAADIMMLTRIHAIYRSTDASMEKAKEQFSHKFMANEHVQNAAVGAASSVLSSQLNSSNNRY